METNGVKTSTSNRYASQAERLSYLPRNDNSDHPGRDMAVEAKFITAQDPVLETAGGGRLPVVSVAEAEKLNKLKRQFDEGHPSQEGRISAGREQRTQDSLEQEPKLEARPSPSASSGRGSKTEGDSASSARNGPSATLLTASPPSRTNPLFPPLPLYGPPGPLLTLQCMIFRASSFFLSLSFLGVVVVGAMFTSLPLMLRNTATRLIGRNPDARRPFHKEELRRKRIRTEAAKAWRHKLRQKNSHREFGDGNEEDAGRETEFELTEGGQDPITCDLAYYARRVGLDAEKYEVQTEDGFLIELWRLYHPKEYTPVSLERRRDKGPDLFVNEDNNCARAYEAHGYIRHTKVKRRYPVLLMHGLLQSAGAYCATDDDSLAFFLCKSGYDVWLGNNRCGFDPKHTLLKYSDPRMWTWNIRQMGVMDLPALISRVLFETGFEKLGLISHSQGTTQTFVALAKEQRPDLGSKISVFCALAPAAYAGPLIGKAYLKFMRIISPSIFRIMFGIHAFIPFMMAMHSMLPARLYGALGYRVFSFLFNWTDTRWERDLRDRMFQFAPVYVSAESMRWWLGKDCFAQHKCILATREETKLEEEIDEKVDRRPSTGSTDHPAPHAIGNKKRLEHMVATRPAGVTAWYDERVPPFALWVAGADDLVDGRKLLRRFERGREPHVRVIHAKVIEEYEHLDVIWAMDSIEKVGKEVRDVVWKTLPGKYRSQCRVPKGCSEVDQIQGL